MKREMRTAVYDDELRIEAYRFEGIMQPFPNHFHRHYVIGLVEGGQRVLSCKNREYVLESGSVVIFNPGDSHACVQSDGGTFDYRGLNIGEQTMLGLAEEITGKHMLPGFSENVVWDGEIACQVRSLHRMIMEETGDFGREETLLFLISLLIQKFGQPFESCVLECRREIGRACEYMEQHFGERIYLDQICRYAGLSKSALLRAFTKAKGVTPYRYLEAVRIGAAKRMLAEGVSPAETAMRTGFSDQSHFTNYFSQFIGLAPGHYRDVFSAGAGRAAGRDEGEAGAKARRVGRDESEAEDRRVGRDEAGAKARRVGRDKAGDSSGYKRGGKGGGYHGE